MVRWNEKRNPISETYDAGTAAMCLWMCEEMRLYWLQEWKSAEHIKWTFCSTSLSGILEYKTNAYMLCAAMSSKILANLLFTLCSPTGPPTGPPTSPPMHHHSCIHWMTLFVILQRAQIHATFVVRHLIWIEYEICIFFVFMRVSCSERFNERCDDGGKCAWWIQWQILLIVVICRL